MLIVYVNFRKAIAKRFHVRGGIENASMARTRQQRGTSDKNTRMNCKQAGSLLLGGGAPVPVRHTERSQVLLLVM